MSRGIARVYTRTSAERETVPASLQLVSPDFFSVLGLTPALGKLLPEATDGRDTYEPVAVVSYAYWQRRFGGSPDAVGSLLVNQRRELHDRRHRPARFRWRVARDTRRHLGAAHGAAARAVPHRASPRMERIFDAALAAAITDLVASRHRARAPGEVSRSPPCSTRASPASSGATAASNSSRSRAGSHGSVSNSRRRSSCCW